MKEGMVNNNNLTNGNIPDVLRYLMVFIDRVGFPILAFLLMFYIAFSTNEKMTTALSANTEALLKLSTSFDIFQKQVMKDHEVMLIKIDKP